MNKLNKMILLFLLSIVLVSGIFWRILQTEYLGSLFSQKISSELMNKYKMNIKFSNISINMFPPSILMKDVVIENFEKQQKTDLSLLASEIYIYLGLINFLSNKVIIEKIKLGDGRIKLRVDKPSQEIPIDFSQINITHVFEKNFFTFLKKLPVIIKKLEIASTWLEVNNQSAWVEELLLKIGKNVLELKANLENISVDDFSNFKLDKIDGLDLRIDYSRGKLLVKEIKIYKNYERYKLSGEFYNASEILNFNGTLSIDGQIDDLLNRMGVKSQKEIDGNVKLDVHLSKSILNPSVEFLLSVRNFISPWAKLESVNLEGKKDNDLIVITKMICEEKAGKLSLINPFAIFDIKTKKNVDNKIVVNAQNLHTNTALYIVKENLDMLKGYMNGNVEVELSRDLKILSFRPLESFYVSELLLVGKTDPIIKNSKVFLETGGFDVNLANDGAVNINTIVKFKNSVLPVKGTIAQKIDIEVMDGEIDFRELGPIAGFPLKGNGDIDLKINNAGKNVIFDFNIGLSEVVVDNFNLGIVVGKVKLNLDDLFLSINAPSCKYQSVLYMAKGDIDIKNQGQLDLIVDVQTGGASDLFKMINPLTQGIEKNILQSINFIIGSKVSIKGKPNGGNLNIEGKLKGKNLQLYTEEFDKFNMDFVFKDNIIQIKDFVIKKHSSSLDGRFSYDLGNKFIDYEIKLMNLKLKDVNIYNVLNWGYDGQIDSTFYGSGPIGELVTRCSIIMSNAYIGDLSVKGSALNIYSNRKSLYVNGEVLGDTIKLDSFINFDNTPKALSQPSYINLDIKTNKVKELAGIVSDHNIKDTTLGGVVEGNIRSTFNVYDLEKLNIALNIIKLNLSKAGKLYRIQADKNQIIMNKGNIEKWDLAVNGDNEWIRSSGEGDQRLGIKIHGEYQIDSSLFEIFSRKIKKADGKIKGNAELVFNNTGYNLMMTSSGKGLSVKIDGLPGMFEKLNFNIVLAKDILELKKFEGIYGGGKVNASGEVILQTPFPKIKIVGKFNDTNLSLFKKTNLTTSGEFELSGDQLPYLLEGKIFLNKADIFDELDELIKSKKTSSNTYDRYLPNLENKRKLVFINYKITIHPTTMISIKNALADIKLDGTVNIDGNPEDPEISGELKIVPASSRLFFKGNEFFINEGRIVLAGENIGKKPEINFLGHAKVNEYDIKLSINGNFDDININFSSEPVLSREDIISLLALGFTTETSKNLQQGDRQAMTSVGLGSLLVEQLKINESLNSSLGLKLSIVQEFQDTESSLVGGTSSSGDHGTTKIRSATKVKVQKQLGKKVDASVSSVVGGSLGEKQEMNLNYNFNKNWTLQGVYEIKTDPEISSESSTSVGADLKLRLSF
ncbi:MAG: hypothetical protein A2381_10770 [Bdellovibrionales bacterium RIFOXYB1_FULL_37_110]|nr:MAG: hypothetical protein A2181_06910 [Bdellovibrionales bacterium RIFOXYA1_FULL_38_20]OFZ51147.1 MAG: hypothetical protein A2417_17755 [Bdellovibrionales bacterium RIFOXYC1_FULL_37_79]OFZ61253.1 MAG: hypothetical protein A2381_10770 [Bdellovibrionales bacterium RIFOXYB1_FULL_37_110]OFZ62116.1 MAG: hypothetical protein A2577_14345 [Bdellovibrionales bacterium RIFOXYD1_FULL_36_51]